MTGLVLINDQLEMVARGSIDWSHHDEVMESVDAELAQLHQRIKIVLSAHEYIVELDDIYARDIDAGKKYPDSDAHALLNKILGLFRQACEELLSEATEFTRKGIPVIGVGVLRKIESDPGAGLRMADTNRQASELDAGTDQRPREIPFDTRVHDLMSQRNNPHRNIG